MRICHCRWFAARHSVSVVVVVALPFFLLHYILKVYSYWGRICAARSHVHKLIKIESTNIFIIVCRLPTVAIAFGNERDFFALSMNAALFSICNAVHSVLFLVWLMLLHFFPIHVGLLQHNFNSCITVNDMVMPSVCDLSSISIMVWRKEHRHNCGTVTLNTNVLKTMHEKKNDQEQRQQQHMQLLNILIMTTHKWIWSLQWN